MRSRHRSVLFVLAATLTLLGAFYAPPAAGSTAKAPPGVDARNWHATKNPVGSPALPRKGKAFKAAARADEVRTAVTNCYPAGVAGFQANCTPPGHQFAYSGDGHWGPEPYYATGYRYVWVVDRLTNARASQWLQFVVNQSNGPNWYQYHPGPGARPYFLYYTAEQAGVGRGRCTGAPSQYVEVCDLPGSISSAANLGWGTDNHYIYNTVEVGTGAAAQGDAYLSYSVLHEFGHAFGFAHDTHCDSVMTYCSTVGTQYLNYAFYDQGLVYSNLYDHHAN